MTAATVIWVLNAMMCLLNVVLLRDTVSPRRQRLRRYRASIIERHVDPLVRDLRRQELAACWEVMLESRHATATDQRAPDLSLMAQRVAVLDAADELAIELVRPTFNASVKQFNSLCALIDEGLIRPRDVVTAFPRAHVELLIVLHLLEPFVWYEHVVSGRGRWGFRPAQLRVILEKLRSASPTSTVRRAVHLEIGGLQLVRLDSVHGTRRVWGLFRLLLRSPTINKRSKLRQRKYAAKLSAELSGYGLVVHRPERRGDAQAW